MALALVRAAARFAERLQGCAEIRDAMAARQHAGALPPPQRAGWEQIIDSALSPHAAGAARATGSFNSLAALAKKIASRSASDMSRSLINLMARGLSEVSGGASLP